MSTSRLQKPETQYLDSSSKLRKGVNKITEELKNMMENGEDYLNSASGLVSGGDEISVSKSLAERYWNFWQTRQTGWKSTSVRW